MPTDDRPVVIAVCGSPAAGKTTVAAATARHLGVLFLTRDEIKTGLGLSSARAAEDGSVRLDPDVHLAGGPFGGRAERVMVNTARLLASSGVSFVVESALISGDLVDALHACGARVLAVHVAADQAVVRERLRARASKGWTVDEQLAAQFERGEMDPSIFHPPRGADAVIEADTSAGEEPRVRIIEAAVVGLLTSGSATGCLGTGTKRS
ncbi:AAA family ATPase [Actinoplanes sp. NPDC089786]|uniref:AAA family ATPase n=1 Tax=Actinoplanes sp. NPDC089786 TaxID=3155185 RepID=UPI00343705EE